MQSTVSILSVVTNDTSIEHSAPFYNVLKKGVMCVKGYIETFPRGVVTPV